MDRFDQKIIDELHKNARISYAELARRVNLSAPAVAERVEKLERAGIITGYHAAVDLSRIGYPIQCLIELTANHMDYFAIVGEIKKLNEIIECYSVTGTTCLTMKVVVDSMLSLQQLIARLMQYGDTKTSVIIDVPVPARIPTMNTY